MGIELVRKIVGGRYRYVAEEEPSGGGVSLIGPFDVTYQTPGVTDPSDAGALVGPELAVGSVVIGGFFVVTSTWTVATGDLDALTLNLSPANVPVAQMNTVNPTNVTVNWPDSPSASNPQMHFIRAVPQQLAVAVYSDDGARIFTGGAASIYALVA